MPVKKTSVLAVITLLGLSMLVTKPAARSDSISLEVGCEETFQSLHRTVDGGFILAGQNDCNEYRAQLIKFDNAGAVEWRSNFGAPRPPDEDWDDQGQEAIPTRDGGYAMTGHASLAYAAWRVSLVKTDASGKKEWARTYAAGEGHAIRQTPDNGYIIAGQSSEAGKNEQVYLLKTDSEGVEQWSRTYGGSGVEWVNDLELTGDGGFILAGIAADAVENMLLVKTDAEGVIEWFSLFSFGGERARAESVRPTRDGGYIVAGWGGDGVDPAAILLVKTNALGTEEWSRSYGQDAGQDCYAVRERRSGGFVLAGTTNFDATHGIDGALLLVDSEGNLEAWERIPEAEKIRSVLEVAPGLYVLAGRSTDDAGLLSGVFGIE